MFCASRELTRRLRMELVAQLLTVRNPEGLKRSLAIGVTFQSNPLPARALSVL